MKNNVTNFELIKINVGGDACVQVTLGITVLLSYSVFMLLVAENMPPTSEFIPLIGRSV